MIIAIYSAPGLEAVPLSGIGFGPNNNVVLQSLARAAGTESPHGRGGRHPRFEGSRLPGGQEPAGRRALAQDVFGDARGDPLGGFAHRIAREMGVARGGLDPRVTQEFSNHGEPLAERQGS